MGTCKSPIYTTKMESISMPQAGEDLGLLKACKITYVVMQALSKASLCNSEFDASFILSTKDSLHKLWRIKQRKLKIVDCSNVSVALRLKFELLSYLILNWGNVFPYCRPPIFVTAKAISWISMSTKKYTSDAYHRAWRQYTIGYKV